MSARLRDAVRQVAARRLGERPAPVGGVARDRRLLRRALAPESAGRVLVVGPGLATRQALPGRHVDVAGTVPHHAEVTVCSLVAGPGSLPEGRWDTVVIAEPGPDLPGRLDAARRACRPGGRVLVLERTGVEGTALSEVATVTGVLGRGRRRLWVGEVAR